MNDQSPNSVSVMRRAFLQRRYDDARARCDSETIFRLGCQISRLDREVDTRVEIMNGEPVVVRDEENVR